MITQENEYYVRYVLLLFKGGAALLRAKTETALRTARLTFKQFIQLSKVMKETQKHLTKAQQELLYPKSGRDASLADLDITVLSHLICLDCIGQDPGDLKTARELRELRNEVAHPGEPQMDFATYIGKWTDLVNLLSVGSLTLTEQEKTSIKATIDSAAKDPLDIAEVLRQLKLLDDSKICCKNIENSLQVIEHSIEMLVKTTDTVKETQVETLGEVRTVKQMMCTFETSHKENSTKVKQGIDDVTKTNKKTHDEVQAVKSTIEKVQFSQQQTCGHVMELSKSVLTVQQTQDKTLDEVEKVSQFVQTQQVTIEEMKKELAVLSENYGNITDVLRVKSKLEVEPESLSAIKLIVEAVEKILSNRQETKNRTKVEDVVAEVLETIEGQNIKVESVSEGSVVLAFRCLSFDAVLQVIECFESSTFQERITDIAKAIEEVAGQFVRIRAFVDILSLQRIIAYYKENPKRKEILLEMACTGIDGLVQAIDTFEGGKMTESVNKLSKALSETVGKPFKVRTSIDRNQMMKTVQAIKRHTETGSSGSAFTEGQQGNNKKTNLFVRSDTINVGTKREWETRTNTELIPKVEYVTIAESTPNRKLKPESESVTETELLHESRTTARPGFKSLSKSKPEIYLRSESESDTATEIMPKLESIPGADLKMESKTKHETKFMPESGTMDKVRLKTTQESESKTKTELNQESEAGDGIKFKTESKSKVGADLKPEAELTTATEPEAETVLFVLESDFDTLYDSRISSQNMRQVCVKNQLSDSETSKETKAKRSTSGTTSYQNEFKEIYNIGNRTPQSTVYMNKSRSLPLEASQEMKAEGTKLLQNEFIETCNVRNRTSQSAFFKKMWRSVSQIFDGPGFR